MGAREARCAEMRDVLAMMSRKPAPEEERPPQTLAEVTAMESWRFDPLCIAEDDPKVSAPSDSSNKFRIKMLPTAPGVALAPTTAIEWGAKIESRLLLIILQPSARISVHRTSFCRPESADIQSGDVIFL